MGFPSSIKVGGVEYKVYWKPIVQNGDTFLNGICSHEKCTIEIRNDINHQRIAQVFVHELIHAMLFECGMLDHAESLVEQLAPVLTQVLKDNDFCWMKNIDEEQ